MKIRTAKAEDRSYVTAVAGRIFSVCREGWPSADPDGFQTLNQGGRAGVAGVEFDGRRCCAKLFYDSRFFVKWRNRLGFSKAGRAFRKGLELKRRGVNCPAMIGYIVDRKSGKALLLTEWAETAQRIDHWVERNGPVPAVAQTLGQFIRWMHDAGVTHDDLSLRNLLIRPAPGGYEFLLLDYEDARFSVAVTEKKRLMNLHHLNERALNTVPENVRREFLAAYLGGGEEIADWCNDLKKMIEAKPSKYTRGAEPERKLDV